MRFISLALAFALVFTSLISLGASETFAASKKAPGKVKITKTSASDFVVTLRWNLPSNLYNSSYKGYTDGGYQVYRNGKKIADAGTSKIWKSYSDPTCKASTTYKYKVRAYNAYKVKVYWNSKTKKWQTKKPAAKYWKKCTKKTDAGYKKKTKTIKKRVYGSFSSVVSVTTKATISYPDLETVRTKVLKAFNDRLTEKADGNPEWLIELNDDANKVAQTLAEKAAKQGSFSRDDCYEYAKANLSKYGIIQDFYADRKSVV
mgnify:CR=1 FL=1